MKKEKGITLVSLGVIILVILIITSTAIYTSMERFEINNANKMINDLELLKDKVSTYYTKYGVLPIASKYSNTADLICVPSAERANCYIIDLSQLEGISLNYGQKGYENQNASNDVYVINIDTHSIYYVKGVKLKDNMYHTIDSSGELKADDIPPTSPELKVISGLEKEDGNTPILYTSEVEIEIVPGKDNWSGISKTLYSTNGSTPNININTLSNNILKLTDNGTYTIKAQSYDELNNKSDITTLTIEIHTSCVWNSGATTIEPTCTTKGEKLYTCTNTRCGATKTEEVATLGHTEETIPEVAATCTTTGLTTGKKCTVCNTVTVVQRRIAALGHLISLKAEIIKEPTCTLTGTSVYKCTRDGCTYSKEGESIPELGHEYVTLEDGSSYPATCTTYGSAHIVCKNGDYDGDVPIYPTGHNWVKISESYYGTALYYTYECSNYGCGMKLENYYVGRCSHDDCEETAVYPTCEEDGHYLYECNDCKFSWTEKMDDGDALGHDWKLTTETPVSLCDHMHKVKYKCKRNYCNAEEYFTVGHYPWEWDELIISGGLATWECRCGTGWTILDGNKTLYDRMKAVLGQYWGYPPERAGIYLWNNYWKLYCETGCNIERNLLVE